MPFHTNASLSQRHQHLFRCLSQMSPHIGLLLILAHTFKLPPYPTVLPYSCPGPKQAFVCLPYRLPFPALRAAFRSALATRMAAIASDAAAVVSSYISSLQPGAASSEMSGTDTPGDGGHMWCSPRCSQSLFEMHSSHCLGSWDSWQDTQKGLMMMLNMIEFPTCKLCTQHQTTGK